MADDEARQTMTKLIKGGRTGMFSTIDSNGGIVSRPMALQDVEFDGDLWFFTADSSDKVSELNANPQVNISFESDNSWVSVSGMASLVEDKAKAKELWNPFVKAWFPGGLEDPELRLIKVQATSAEYWDTNNKLVSLFKMARAAATDTVPDMADNKTLDLSDD